MPRPRSRTAARWLTAAALALVLPACDLSTGTDGRTIAGDWLATGYTLESAETDASVSLIPGEGWFRYMSFGPSGFLEDNEWSPIDGWDRRRGEWLTNDTVLAIDDGATVTEYGYRLLPGERLRLTRSQAGGWDFDGDGAGDPTIRVIELVRADENPDGAVLASWSARSYTFTADADPSTTYDLVADGGSFSITFSHVGTYQATEERPGDEQPRTDSGDFAALVGSLWFIDNSSVDFATYAFEGDTLVLSFPRAEWDFDGDGSPDPATAVVRLTEDA